MEIISKHILSFQACCGFWTPELCFSLWIVHCVFSVPCLFMSVMCKSPNVPAFEFPANSSSASRKTCISLPHCCSAPQGQAVWAECSACRDWRAGCSCPTLSLFFQENWGLTLPAQIISESKALQGQLNKFGHYTYFFFPFSHISLWIRKLSKCHSNVILPGYSWQTWVGWIPEIVTNLRVNPLALFKISISLHFHLYFTGF